MPVSVLLADDHQIVRQGIKVLLEREGFEIVGEAADGREAVQMASKTRPDVAVLDFVMPLLNGLDSAIQIHRESPSTKCILLTMYTEDQYVLEAFRGGLRGYVIKTQASEELIHAIREVTGGGIYLSPCGVYGVVVGAYLTGRNLTPDPLTSREREVLQLVAEGHTTKEIAGALKLSVKTAESYRSRIMEKLGIHETAGLVRYAIRCGLIQA